MGMRGSESHRMLGTTGAMVSPIFRHFSQFRLEDGFSMVLDD